MWNLPFVIATAVCAALLFGYAGAAVASTIWGPFLLAAIAVGLAINGYVEGRRMFVEAPNAPNLPFA